jgi:hypothetical protein
VVVGVETYDPADRSGGENLAATFATTGATKPPYNPEAFCLLRYTD